MIEPAGVVQREFAELVNGTTGFIGSAVVRELIGAGHQVVGLARSDAAAALTAAGAQLHRGALDDLDSLRSAAGASDGVIHTAFIHDFSDYAGAAEADRRAIEAIGEAIAGSDRPFVVTSGMAALTPGRLATEKTRLTQAFPVRRNRRRCHSPRAGCASRCCGFRRRCTARAITVSCGSSSVSLALKVFGLPRRRIQPLGRGAPARRCAAVPAGPEKRPGGRATARSRRRGRAYSRHRRGHWPAFAAAGECCRGDQAFDHFGFPGAIFAMDVAASSAITQKQLDWHPAEPGLIDDLEKGHCFFKD